MLKDFLISIGLKGSVIVAACGGSLARIGLFGISSGPVSTIFTTIAGTIVGVYLGPVGPWYLGWPEDSKSTLAVTCMVALLSVEIGKRLQLYATAWVPLRNGNGKK